MPPALEGQKSKTHTNIKQGSVFTLRSHITRRSSAHAAGSAGPEIKNAQKYEQGFNFHFTVSY